MVLPSLPVSRRRLLWLAFLLPLADSSAAAQVRTFDAAYSVALEPSSGLARVSLVLKGERLPSRLTFTIDPARHLHFRADGELKVDATRVTWWPPDGQGTLSFDFGVNRQLPSGTYDSYIGPDWAVFRGDRLIPPVSSRAVRNLSAETTLQFHLPVGWSVMTPYPERERRFVVRHPDRRFDRPQGWMLAGRIGSRHETIAGVSTFVGAPVGEDARRQDTLAFLNWNLPHLLAVFPEFTRRLLIVRAGEPMFRGGLSGPASLFLHTDRPLISENRTSPILHELIHVAMGIRGDRESDWIVEGFAEFYSIELLRRSGSISERRFREAIAEQQEWGRLMPRLFVATSTGATTARAVAVLMAADAEIRAVTAGKASLDDVARALAATRGEVSLELLQREAAKVAGMPLKSLERDQLM